LGALAFDRARPIARDVSPTDPPAFPDDELRARVTARQIRQSLHTGTLMLMGVGLLMAVAVAAMLVVAW
jgi:hypothetical protein